MNEQIIKPAKPFLRWAGGKTRLINKLGVKLWPEEFNSSVNTYFEPFLGGGAMFFNYLPENAVLSDLNADLIITYNAIKNDVESVIQLVKEHEANMRAGVHKEYYYKVRLNKYDGMPEAEIASRFMFLNATCFNGIYRVNKKEEFNTPFGYTDIKKKRVICNADNLRLASEALQGVDIINQDYKKVLDTAKYGDFVYLDPPYYPLEDSKSTVTYTADKFMEKEQTELKDVFIELMSRGCFVELSNSDTRFINELYSSVGGVLIRRVEIGRCISGVASKRGNVSELVISNF